MRVVRVVTSASDSVVETRAYHRTTSKRVTGEVYIVQVDLALEGVHKVGDLLIFGFAVIVYSLAVTLTTDKPTERMVCLVDLANTHRQLKSS